MNANPIKTIRDRLGVTQATLAEALRCTQGNVGHYERGQTVPPDMAKRLIQFAAARGQHVSYDDIYGPPLGEQHDTVRVPSPVGAAEPVTAGEG